MENKIRNFRDLKIWQKGIQLVVDIYQLSRQFPGDELFGLCSQMKRCAVSIPANVAEGFNRYHQKEYSHFLYITLGSCSELETHLEISHRLNFISAEIKNTFVSRITEITKMTRTLIKRIDEKK